MFLPQLVPSPEYPDEDSLFGTGPQPSSSFVYVNEMLPLYEDVFTEISELSVSVTTFNVACKKPAPPLTGIAALTNSKTGGPTDIVVLALQEVDMSATALIREETEAALPWILAANEAIGANSQPKADCATPYYALPPKQMVGLMLLVYVRRPLVPLIREHHIALVPTGALGSVGNKGAVGLRLVIHRSSIVFLSAHLAAGQNAVALRNSSIETILTNMDFNALKRAEYEKLQGSNAPVDAMKIFPPIHLRDQDVVIIAGDLNYRLNLTYDQSLRLTKLQRYSELLQHDQLIAEMKNRHTPWWGFNDLTPSFPPTYRFDIGTNTYDTSEKHRIPGYTDRVCVYVKDSSLVSQVCVDSMHVLMNVKSSDHKPLVTTMRIPVRQEIVAKREELEARLNDQYNTLNASLIYRTETKVSANEISFGNLQIYRDSPLQTVTITNTGTIAASVRVIRVNSGSDMTLASWLRVSPTELVILPGKSKSVTISTCIDPVSCRWLNTWKPFEGRATLALQSVLKFVVRCSESHSLTCKGTLIPSVFGNRLDHVYILGNKVCIEAYQLRGDLAYEMQNLTPQIPKEVWFMGDVLFRHPQQPGLFIRTVDSATAIEVMNHLDTRCSMFTEDSGSLALAVGHCLVTFLRQLLDPVIPNDFYAAALDSIKIPGKDPLLVLRKMPAIHANLFLYIMSLLQYLLRPAHAVYNGLTIGTVSDLFSTVMFRPQISNGNAMKLAAAAATSLPNESGGSLNQQERVQLEDEQQLAKRFIEYFLVPRSPAL